MNERFIKLALDAGLLNYVDHETPRHYFINGHAEQEDVEKFAELIVRECIDIAGKEDFDVMMKEGYPCSQTAKKIKQHFGVEE